MEKFLEDLRKALEEAGVEQVDEIVAEYLEHFTIGHEAGMIDEEIIERFDSIEDIVHNAVDEKEPSSRYDVILDLECFSEFQFVQKSELLGIDFEIDEDANKYVSVVRDGRRVHLKSKVFNTLFKKRNFKGTVFIGKNVLFDQFTINNVNCDITCECKIMCSDFSLSNVNGDFEQMDIIAEESIVITNTNGDIEISRLEAPHIKISTVSGDIHIEEFTADNVKLSTVSGDISIELATGAEYNINSVSGDVRIEAGAEDSKVKVSTVSGEVEISGKVISKSVSDIIKKSFKW